MRSALRHCLLAEQQQEPAKLFPNELGQFPIPAYKRVASSVGAPLPAYVGGTCAPIGVSKVEVNVCAALDLTAMERAAHGGELRALHASG